MKRICQTSMLFATLALAGCGGGNEDQQAKAPNNYQDNSPTPAATTEPMQTTPETQPSSTGMPTTPPPSTSSSGPTSENMPPSTMPNAGSSTDNNTTGGTTSNNNLTDAQIAAVTKAINDGEVQEAKLAETKAQNAQVKQFARTMDNEHNAELRRQTQLLQRLQITPADSSVSNDLASDVRRTLDSLRDTTGHEFDVAYIDAMVRGHSKVLDIIDKQLLPNVKNAELKASLEQARAKVATHMQHAMDVQKKLDQSQSGKSNNNNNNNNNNTQQQPQGQPKNNP